MNYRYLFAAALIAAAAPKALNAQGWIDIERRPGIPVNTSVFRVSSNVRTRVEGRVATIEVEEQFRNTGGGIAEGTYLYPLPGEAVFQNFSLWMGETEVRGDGMAASQARRSAARNEASAARSGSPPRCWVRKSRKPAMSAL